MGAGASASVAERLSKASLEELREAVDNLSDADKTKLSTALGEGGGAQVPSAAKFAEVPSEAVTATGGVAEVPLAAKVAEVPSDAVTAEPVEKIVRKATKQDHIKKLIQQQRSEFPGILANLEKRGKKTGHWIWWAFPTERPGACDPIRTYVTKGSAKELFGEDTAEKLWREVMESLCCLVEKNGQQAIPYADHGRIHYFLLLWSTIPGVPDWMGRVRERLSKFFWEE